MFIFNTLTEMESCFLFLFLIMWVFFQFQVNFILFWGRGCALIFLSCPECCTYQSRRKSPIIKISSFFTIQCTKRKKEAENREQIRLALTKILRCSRKTTVSTIKYNLKTVNLYNAAGKKFSYRFCIKKTPAAVSH